MRLLVTAAAIAAFTLPATAATYGSGQACQLHNGKLTAAISHAVDSVPPSYLLEERRIIGPELVCYVPRAGKISEAGITFRVSCEGQGETWDTDATVKVVAFYRDVSAVSLTMEGTSLVLLDCGPRFAKKPPDLASKKNH